MLQDGLNTVCHGVDTLNTNTNEVHYTLFQVQPDELNGIVTRFIMFLQVVRFISKVILLASGGAGHIYPSTTNPPVQ